MKSYIDRIQLVQPYIFALAEQRFEKAMAEAKLVDLYVASKAASPQQIEFKTPLLGVPFSVKMIFHVKGLPFTGDPLLHKDLKATSDADVVARMKRFGAISLISTTIQDMSTNVDSERYGTTNNPYNTSRTVGLTSGGEAAMIAAGGSVIGLGNDMIGSLRLPAFFTGIFSHKPSRGLVRNEGTFIAIEEVQHVLCTGPICRYAEDLSLCMKVLMQSNKNGKDFDKPVNFRELKIYYMLDDGTSFPLPKVEDDIIRALRKVICYFEETYDIKAKQYNLPNMKHAFVACNHVIMPLVKYAVLSMLRLAGRDNDFYNIVKKVFTRKYEFSVFAIIFHYLTKLPMIKSSTLMNYCKSLLDEICRELEALLDENSVFLCPTSYRTALYHGENLLSFGQNMAYAGIFSSAGMPVTQCPAGLARDGLPVGFQVAARIGNDALTIACAKEIEKCLGGWVPPQTGYVVK